MNIKITSYLSGGKGYAYLMRNLSILVCCLILTGCSKDQAPFSLSEERTTLHFGTTISTQTRATEAGFEISDTIGLYLAKWTDASTPGNLTASGNYADNAWYRLENNSDTWTSKQTIYYPSDDNKIDLYAYYPYRTPAFFSGTSIHLSVASDQSSYRDYTRSDFMTAKTAGVKRNPDKVSLTFNHMLSQIVFQLKPGLGFNTTDLLTAKIKVVNAILDATYDLSQAVTEKPIAGTSRGDLTPCGLWRQDGSSLTGVIAILIPQELNSNTYIQVSLGNRKFTFKPESIQLNSGCSRKFTITVNNTGLDITTSINPWNTCPAVNGEANEEFEDTDIWAGDTATSFCGGTGTKDNPYLICSGAALTYLSMQVNNGNHYTDAYFRITKNLDMNNLSFIPIGIDRDKEFRGHFDGGGHIISNLNIESPTLERIGLFSVLNWNDPNILSTISNLGIKNANVAGRISTSGVVGGIVGESRYGKIENCFFQGNLTNTKGATSGGICGYHFDTVTIVRNCYSIVENLDSREGGPVLGLVYSEGGFVENCYGVLKKYRSSSYIGNFIGAIAKYQNPITLRANNNYYDSTICGLGPIGKGEMSFFIATGKTSTELKSPSMPSILGSAFKQDVANVNEGYPILTWQ